MACRALTTIHPARPKRIQPLMTDTDRPTQPDTERPAQDDLIIPPHGSVHLPSPNPNSYQDYVLSELLNRSRNLDAERKEFISALDRQDIRIATRLDGNHRLVKQEIDANYRLLHLEVVSIGRRMDALGDQIKVHDSRLDLLESGEERFERIELELATMRLQLDRLDQVRGHVDSLEAELARLRSPGA